MKHFLRFLYLRARDIVREAGLPPYQYMGTGLQSRQVLATYSLERALRDAPVDPSTATPGTKIGTKYVMVGPRQYSLRQDRFGRTHLPKALRERIL